jgi:hypothetical protein
MIRIPFVTLALVLAIAACGRSDPVDTQAGAAAAKLPDVKPSAPISTGEPRGATSPAKPLPAAAEPIPAALQGRWGLAPADCIAGRSDAKGLLIVAPGGLRFYESRAVPAADVGSEPNSISGNFDFTGEGRSWTKYEALKVNRQVLVRTEINPAVSFSYAKCN